MAERSIEQSALLRDTGPGGFMERLPYILCDVAKSVLTESAGTVFHTSRAVYAQQVLANPGTLAKTAAPVIIGGINVYTSTAYDPVTKTATCSATDAALISQVTTLWNAIAGLNTPA